MLKIINSGSFGFIVIGFVLSDRMMEWGLSVRDGWNWIGRRLVVMGRDRMVRKDKTEKSWETQKNRHSFLIDCRLVVIKGTFSISRDHSRLVVIILD